MLIKSCMFLFLSLTCSVFFSIACQIYFQSMMTEGINMDEENAMQGEIEIERIPTRMIEARPKDLVPVFDYLQTPKFLHARCVEVLYVHFSDYVDSNIVFILSRDTLIKI